MREIHGVNSFAIGVHLNLMNSIISGNYVWGQTLTWRHRCRGSSLIFRSTYLQNQ